MSKGILVDAGPLIAILSRDDRDHDRCVATLKTLRGPLLTTWMAVTEAMYLLGFSREGPAALLEMIERRALRILDIERKDLPEIRALLHKYEDLAMDFANATLVRAAIREGISDIFTLDRRDFSVYRLGTRRGFTIVPV